MISREDALLANELVNDNDVDATAAPSSSRSAALPVPKTRRWKLLRSGLLNLFKFDEQVFEYEDGHLLLRGNNGTGKSRILALQLPFLLDGDVSPQRVEPDGDAAKRMEWNLLLGKYPDRLGYTWLELGRVDDDGHAHYTTIGCGLRAATGRPLSRWFFVTPQRVGESLELQAEGHPHTRARLTEALGDAGTVYTTARDYRQAVDERLFQLGESRYRALVDLLIQLRQPQLSRHLDEQRLSNALSEALPPLSSSVLADVAESFRSLEADRHQLESFLELQNSTHDFLKEYARYARLATIRRVGEMRRAHNTYEQTQRSARELDESLAATRTELEAADAERARLESDEERRQEEIRTLESSPEMKSAQELDRARASVREREDALSQTERELELARADRDRARGDVERLAAALAEGTKRVDALAIRAATAASDAEHERDHRRLREALGAEEHGREETRPAETDVDASRRRLAEIAAARRESIGVLSDQRRRVDAAKQSHDLARRDLTSAEERLAEARETHVDANDALDAALGQYWDEYATWRHECRELTPAPADELEEAVDFWVREGDGPNPLRTQLTEASGEVRERLQRELSRAQLALDRVHEQRATLEEERDRLERGVPPVPAPLPRRDAQARTERPGAPFWQLVDFRDDVSEQDRAAVEAALESAGLLDAWIEPEGRLTDAAGEDVYLLANAEPGDARGSAEDGTAENTDRLDTVLVPAAEPFDARAASVPRETTARILAGIALCDRLSSDSDPVDNTAPPHAPAIRIARDGQWQMGIARGVAHKASAEYLGVAAREAARKRRLAALAAELERIRAELEARAEDRQRWVDALARLDHELATLPADDALIHHRAALHAAAREVDRARGRCQEAERRCEERRHELEAITAEFQEVAADLDLAGWIDQLPQLAQLSAEYERAAERWLDAIAHRVERQAAHDRARDTLERTEARVTLQTEHGQEARSRRDRARGHLEALERTSGQTAAAVLARLEQTRKAHEATRRALRLQQGVRTELLATLKSATEQLASLQRTLEERTTERQAVVARFERFLRTRLVSIAIDPEEWTELEGDADAEAEDLTTASDGFEPSDTDPNVDSEVTRDAETTDPASDRNATDPLWIIPDGIPLSPTRAIRIARALVPHLGSGDADDTQWERAENALYRQIEQLRDALHPHDHRPETERSEDVWVVRVPVQGRALTVRELARYFEDQVSERQRLLDAREREVIENHLIGEIAQHLGDRLREGDQWVREINGELADRPTTTGMTLRFAWKPLEDGPAGLEAARRRLLGEGALWSPEERAAVGRFLHEQIERVRTDREGGTWREHLIEALDYRTWHRFVVERRQDGKWVPLTRRTHGTGSGGEKSVALTIPQLAAAAAHYRSAADIAPRIILLDEVFVAVDADMRAKCMGLIEAFDLDFIVTSESEWLAYPTVSGVAIYHLSTRDGWDAIGTSRWVWNGHERLSDADARRARPVAAQSPADPPPPTRTGSPTTQPAPPQQPEPPA